MAGIRGIRIMDCPICGNRPTKTRLHVRPGHYDYNLEHCGIRSGYSNDWDWAVINWNMAVDWYGKYGRENKDGTD